MPGPYEATDPTWMINAEAVLIFVFGKNFAGSRGHRLDISSIVSAEMEKPSGHAAPPTLIRRLSAESIRGKISPRNAMAAAMER